MTVFHQMRKWCLIAFLACVSVPMAAQRVSVKTNVLYWATASPNVGLEFRLNRHLTLNVEGAANYFKIKDISTHGMAFMPEMRYWFSLRPQAGHSVGIMGLVADYDVVFNGNKHKGDAFGFGPTYGYSFVLSRHLSLETTLGLGLLRVREKNFKPDSQVCPTEPNNCKWMVAPLKLGVTFVYIIK